MEYVLVAGVALVLFQLAGRRDHGPDPELEVDEPDRLLVG